MGRCRRGDVPGQEVAYFFKQVSARQDEQGIDEIGRALDGKARVIREVPPYIYEWAEMRVKGETGKENVT